MCNPAEMFYPRDARLSFHTAKTHCGHSAIDFAVMHNSTTVW
jgi:hypothetical protein